MSSKRNYAAQCLDAAKSAPAEERQKLLDMAMTSFELAAETDRSNWWASASEQIAVGLWTNVAIEYNGKIITGSYSVSDWMITVKVKDGGNKSTQLTGAAPQILAKSLLHELAQR
jgi:hypothetical protein